MSQQHLLRPLPNSGDRDTVLQQRRQGVHLHGQDRPIARPLQARNGQPGRQVGPLDVAVALETKLIHPGGQRREGLLPGLRPTLGGGFERPQLQHDAIITEHLQYG